MLLLILLIMYLNQLKNTIDVQYYVNASYRELFYFVTQLLLCHMKLVDLSVWRFCVGISNVLVLLKYLCSSRKKNTTKENDRGEKFLQIHQR